MMWPQIITLESTSSLPGDEGILEWVDNIRPRVELACLSATLSFASLAGPGWEKGEMWRRFERLD